MATALFRMYQVNGLNSEFESEDQCSATENT